MSSLSKLVGVGWGPWPWPFGMACPRPGPGSLQISFSTSKPVLEQGYFSTSRCPLQVQSSLISWVLLIKHLKNLI